jgi:nitrite reductase (NADH) small subunit
MSARAVNLGPVERIPEGEGRTFDVGARRIAVFRTRRGGVYATQAECPHRRGPLADGLLGERSVVCPLHGYKFDLASGDGLGHTCGALRTFPVDVDERGDVRLVVED